MGGGLDKELSKARENKETRIDVSQKGISSIPKNILLKLGS
jgi:hypothetical protein